MNETEFYRMIIEEAPRAALLVNNFPEEIGNLINAVAFLVKMSGVIMLCYAFSLLFKPLATHKTPQKEEPQ